MEPDPSQHDRNISISSSIQTFDLSDIDLDLVRPMNTEADAESQRTKRASSTYGVARKLFFAYCISM
jgi:hypothetical protein